ncbi:MAG: hypothetical protein AAGN82_32055 [Myxococcota bacterium]
MARDEMALEAVAYELPPESAAQRRLPLDVGWIVAREAPGYLVRLGDGAEHHATLGAGVLPALADECVREGRPVLVRASDDGWVVLGALQTAPSAAVVRDGVVTVTGREVRLEAEAELLVEAGPTRLRLDRRGRVSLSAERLTMRVASLIKLIASKVELP